MLHVVTFLAKFLKDCWPIFTYISRTILARTLGFVSFQKFICVDYGSTVNFWFLMKNEQVYHHRTVEQQ